MTGLSALEFISKYGEGCTPLVPVDDARKFFDRIMEGGLYIPKFNKGSLIGLLTYYRSRSFKGVKPLDNKWTLPNHIDRGPYIYISFVVIRPGSRNKGTMNYFRKKILQLKPIVKAAVWEEQDGIWHIEERLSSMQTNCGILAFDKLAGMLNGRANVISLWRVSR